MGFAWNSGLEWGRVGSDGPGCGGQSAMGRDALARWRGADSRGGEGCGRVGGSEDGFWESCGGAVVCRAGKAARGWWRVGAGECHEVSRRGTGGPGHGLGNKMEVRMPIPQLGQSLGQRLVSWA